MGEGSNIFTPFQIDFGCQMTIGKYVFINHNFTAMAARPKPIKKLRD